MKSPIVFSLATLLVMAIVSCTPIEKQNTSSTSVDEISDKHTQTATEGKKIENPLAKFVLQKCIEAHGGELYKTAHYSFNFREKEYEFKNDGNNYEYRMAGIVKGEKVKHALINGNFSQFVDGDSIVLSKKESKYSESLNSVIYFATLPHKLEDPAVNKTHLGQVAIKNKTYDILKVTFKQEGGGKDFEDEYYYWINTLSHKIDYLAYNYQVNGGGVRFREAYNKRVVDGITFQDYVNYKAEVGIPLNDLPKLFEEGQLEELSRIETENVVSLK